ncbi:hypothetical protein ALT785_700015 [Alteromonas infernus]
MSDVDSIFPFFSLEACTVFLSFSTSSSFVLCANTGVVIDMIAKDNSESLKVGYFFFVVSIFISRRGDFIFLKLGLAAALHIG